MHSMQAFDRAVSYVEKAREATNPAAKSGLLKAAARAVKDMDADVRNDIAAMIAEVQAEGPGDMDA